MAIEARLEIWESNIKKFSKEWLDTDPKWLDNNSKTKQSHYLSGWNGPLPDCKKIADFCLEMINQNPTLKDVRARLIMNVAMAKINYSDYQKKMEKILEKLIYLPEKIYKKTAQEKIDRLLNQWKELRQGLNEQWGIYESSVLRLQRCKEFPIIYESRTKIIVENFFSEEHWVLLKEESIQENQKSQINQAYKICENILHLHGKYLRIFLRIVNQTACVFLEFYSCLNEIQKNVEELESDKSLTSDFLPSSDETDTDDSESLDQELEEGAPVQPKRKTNLLTNEPDAKKIKQGAELVSNNATSSTPPPDQPLQSQSQEGDHPD